ncbi:hypothetical protein [Streptomyces sp. SID5910]|uniref:hypothetical protein n=1 Tax=Streptomyces sp. SID5910 TaxID=2690312 RepID=UPI001928220E|nr:hypothetical protein [Streptomyces sp. SID5910]
METIDAWSRHEDYRVRRLASEAVRPLLPWAPRLALPVDAGLPGRRFPAVAFTVVDT